MFLKWAERLKQLNQCTAPRTFIPSAHAVALINAVTDLIKTQLSFRGVTRPRRPGLEVRNPPAHLLRSGGRYFEYSHFKLHAAEERPKPK